MFLHVLLVFDVMHGFEMLCPPSFGEVQLHKILIFFSINSFFHVLFSMSASWNFSSIFIICSYCVLCSFFSYHFSSYKFSNCYKFLKTSILMFCSIFQHLWVEDQLFLFKLKHVNLWFFPFYVMTFCIFSSMFQCLSLLPLVEHH